MDSVVECKIPLLWTANGFVEIIQQDNICHAEAKKCLKILEDHLAPENYFNFRPNSCSSNDVSSESDSQEKSSNDGLDDLFKESVVCIQKNKSLKDPMLCYKDEKHHVCDTCGKRFSRKFNLNTHIKCVHSDEKDYVCEYCQRAFNHSSNLRKHIRTVHGTEKRLPCPLCEKPFKHPVALRNHIKIIHGRDFISG